MDIETMRKIVDGAPELADTYLFHGIYSDSKIVDCGAVGISLDGLRIAIANHDRTDHVTDIRNHISPMTIVQGE